MAAETESSRARPTVVILGASADRSKFGNKSVRAHADQGYEVFPVNPRQDEIEGWTAYPSVSRIPLAKIERISVYLPPNVTLGLLAEIATKSPEEFWLNPGSESPELVARARELGLDPILGCSIVNLGVSPADFP